MLDGTKFTSKKIKIRVHTGDKGVRRHKAFSCNPAEPLEPGGWRRTGDDSAGISPDFDKFATLAFSGGRPAEGGKDFSN